MASERERIGKKARDPRLVTPDGRYLVVHGRLWRRSNPVLNDEERERLVGDLMSARRAVAAARRTADAEKEAAAHEAVDAAKRALGERGPAWWDDGAPDYNRHMARNSPYADWFAGLDGATTSRPSPARPGPKALGLPDQPTPG